MNKIKPIYVALLCLVLLTFTSAKRANRNRPKPMTLTSIHLVDRNGLSETVSNKERLTQFQNTDFLKSQPYQKVLRIWSRDSKGAMRSIANTYYENGQPKQYLEIINGRANGIYCEWHENGAMSLFTHVIGGMPDVTAVAERSWIYDGPSYAWNAEGSIIAEINYIQGSLEGSSVHYHPSGQIWKKIPYVKNQLEGTAEIFKQNGELLQQINYCQGLKDGPSLRYWDSEFLASQEMYSRGKLIEGQYFDKQSELIAEVQNGNGYRATFGKEGVQELQEHVDGIAEGEVKVFNQEGALKRLYHIKSGIKHGEEIEYYDRHPSPDPQPRLSFNWYEGKIQGEVKTWYPNGVMESHKEMANNAKNGILTVWYKDGSLLMLEEYDNNKLVRGDYLKKGEKFPISQVRQGKGVVTMFDPDGHFVQKIPYQNGKPDEFCLN